VEAIRTCCENTADATQMCRDKTRNATRTKYNLGTQFECAESFTQYKYLEKYLNICFAILKEKKNSEQKIPTCFIRNDVNKFCPLSDSMATIKNF